MYNCMMYFLEKKSLMKTLLCEQSGPDKSRELIRTGQDQPNTLFSEVITSHVTASKKTMIWQQNLVLKKSESYVSL